jgi:proteasome accessory factor B
MQTVVERVINLLIYLLESPHPVTADEIRQTVAGYDQGSDEAFHRMFERDKDVLRRLGVPLELKALDVWEVDFGYSVDPDEYAIPDPGLTNEERAALSLAARMVRIGEGDPGLQGLFKLGGVEHGLGMEPIGADLGLDAGILGELFKAVTERRRIKMTYRGNQRSLRPYGIAHRRGHWYLAGDTDEGSRVYRIDRISGLELGETAGAFDRPKNFSVRDLMNSQPWESGQDQVVDATIRFDPDVGWWAARSLGEKPPDSGAFEVTLPVANRDAFMGWILSFGDSVEIVAPDELRADLRDRVSAAMAGLS